MTAWSVCCVARPLL